MNVDCVPVAFVALDDAGAIVGTASLIFDDLQGDPRNPWLASVFVPSEQRGKGIASVLVRTVEDAARRIGYSRLYLFTTLATALYAGLGWRTLEQRAYRGEHIQVMDKDLSPERSKRAPRTTEETRCRPICITCRSTRSRDD